MNSQTFWQITLIFIFFVI
jgi:hypothetical protein